MATLAAKVDYYVDRLILQYRTKAKARATVAIGVKTILADDLASQLSLAFSLDQAVGPQLDVLGKYIGVGRNIGRSSPPGLFSLWDYHASFDPAKYQGTWDPATDNPVIPAAAGGNDGFWYVASADGHSVSPIAADFQCGDIIWSNGAVWAKSTEESGNGLTSYSNGGINANGVFWSYSAAGRAFSALTDESYRTVLKLQAILNHNDGTLSAIVKALVTFFPGQIKVVDNTDMTLTYTVLSTVPLSKEILTSFLPRPMGVGITVIIVDPVPAGGGKLTTEDGSILTTEDGSPLLVEPT
jgi:hypothetical protein